MSDFDDAMANAGAVAPDVEVLLQRLVELIEAGRPMPMSATVRINRDEALELLDEAIARLPEQLKAARWLLREREEFLARVEREGDEILDAARARAERMVQRTEVVRSADARARQLIEEADAESRRLRHEAEDFCDQRLAQFEIVLDRTIKTVRAGRQRLTEAAPTGSTPNTVTDAGPLGDEGDVDSTEAEFFDQDDF